MNSFYGGLNGQSFAYKTIFTTYKALQNDLTKGWASPVSVGEFVLVSYGMPNDDGYEGYKLIDLDYTSITLGEAKTYNSTLWQKTYTKPEVEGSTGLDYKFITSMTGNTPLITIDKPVTVIDADQDPDIDVDNTDVDNPRIIFKLPQSQVIGLKDTVVVASNVEPSVDLDKTDINNPMLTFTLPRSQVIEEVISTAINSGATPTARLDIGLNPGDTGTIDNPIIRLELPVSQTWMQGTITAIDANLDPTFNITNYVDSTTSIENPNIKVISFELPKSQVLHLGTTQILDADQMPAMALNNADINNPVVTFSIPQAQVMASPTVQVKDSRTNPDVTLDDTVDVNAPFLKFVLPRAAKIETGELTADSESAAVPIPSGFDLAHGDYFLNKKSGYLYMVNATGELEYQCNLQVPKPTVNATSIDPYVGAGGPASDPTIQTQLTTTGWIMTFGLPQAPTLAADYEMIGAEETGEVTSEILDSKTVQFNFNIPRGAKFFAAEGAPSTIAEAKIGDAYVDTLTGFVYKLTADRWEKQNGTLQGPVGETLRFVANYEVTETATLTNTPENTYAYIEANYLDPVEQNDIISFTWIDEDGGSTAYWCFKGNTGVWSRVLLTGGVAGLIELAYSVDETKTYSTTYINALIGEIGSEDATAKSRKAYSMADVDGKITAINQSISDARTELGQDITDLREDFTQLSTDLTQDLNDHKTDVATALSNMKTEILNELEWGSFAQLIPTTT